ncbi:hypothetical protein SUGI_0223360 [Cryptomeria japonica]|nr:hypothetical protein SUGI_0223360 [Cryptomeria japonica]
MLGSGSGNGSGNDNCNGNGNSSQLSEKEKGSRNKRKFRADPPPPLPLVPCTECNAHANGNANKGFVALGGYKMGYHSGESFNGNSTDVDGNGIPSATHFHSHNYNHNHNQSHNHNHNHNHSHCHNAACYATSEFCNSCKAHQEHLNSCKCSAFLNGGKGVQPDTRETSYGYEECSSGDRLQEERELEELQEADWSGGTESQLEELLLSNLDAIYKSAMKKIVASGYTEDMALKAVLKHAVVMQCGAS